MAFTCLPITWTLGVVLRQAGTAVAGAWGLAVAGIAIGLAFVLAEVSWRVLEKPLIDLGQSRFRYGKSHP